MTAVTIEPRDQSPMRTWRRISADFGASRRHAIAPMIRQFQKLIARDVTRSVIGTIFLKVASGGVAFAMFSLAARNMSSDDFGNLAMWLSVGQIGCVIGLFGQEMLIVRSLNEYSVANRPRRIKGILLFSGGVALVVSILASITVVCFARLARHDSPALILAVALFMMTTSAIMLGSQIARSLVGILMGEGSRDLFWRLLVVIVLLVTLFTRRGIGPEEFFICLCGGSGARPHRPGDQHLAGAIQ